MPKPDLKKLLRSLSSAERGKLFPGLREEEFDALLSRSDREILEALQKTAFAAAPAPKAKSVRWFDRKLSGLTREGREHLRELTAQASYPGPPRHVEARQVRYLKQLSRMKLRVPDLFRSRVNPRELYRHLLGFCRENDIPEEIVQRIIPALVSYIETGHMRPVIFVGEKGCGKTTAVRMLVSEALQLPVEVIKIPQTDGGHGMTGDSGTYMSADVGCIAKARLRADSLLVAYVFDEIDKVTHGRNRASVDDELLSITDESCCEVYDNYLETTLVGLEYCPMFMTANDLQKVSPILADRCTVIRFPDANASRIKSISRKFADKKLESSLYSMIDFDYELMDIHIDDLVHHNVTSLRKHQQMIEAVLESALNAALDRESEEPIKVTEDMFIDAEEAVLGAVKRRAGFG